MRRLFRPTRKFKIAVFSAVYTLFMCYLLPFEVSFMRAVFSRMDLHYAGLLMDLPGCRFPQYDTFHWTIRLVSYGQDERLHWSCQGPAVVYLNDSSLAVDKDRLRERYGLDPSEISCSYREIFRNLGEHYADKVYHKSLERTVAIGQALIGEYFEVWCTANSSTLFKEYFLIPRKTSGNTTWRQGQLNVLVLGLDSTSRLNFYRRLKKTRRFLMTELNALEFLGYNKLGENSFPNQIPLLSGLSGDAVRALYVHQYFDGLPLLWNTFKARGYKTLFLEEMAHAGLFLYPNLSGFWNQPTDVYPQPLIRAIDVDEQGRKFCAGSRLKTQLYLDYLRDQLSMEYKVFAYAWITDVPHGNHTLLGILDDPLEGFLRQLSSRGILERTALLFLSDHGVRYGTVRLTEAGRHEDLTPFCFLVLPERFFRQHPEAAVHLQTNQRRLITAYDLHATLVSLADLPSLHSKPTDKGLSLFGAVPAERSCSDVFVPIHFCACLGSRRAGTNHEQAEALGRYVLAYINAKAEFSFPGLCQRWSLASVDDAEVLGGQVAGKVVFRVTLTTEPNAHFEVLGTIDNETEQPYRVDLVQRLDWYSNDTKCLPRSLLKQFCKCKK